MDILRNDSATDPDFDVFLQGTHDPVLAGSSLVASPGGYYAEFASMPTLTATVVRAYYAKISIGTGGPLMLDSGDRYVGGANNTDSIFLPYVRAKYEAGLAAADLDFQVIAVPS